MPDKTRRKQLLADYKQTPPAAGVYCVRNSHSHQVLVGSSTNLPSVGAKLDFARSTGSTGALDRRLQSDATRFGLDSLSLEILEVLEPKPGLTPQQIQADLTTLESLWREKFAPDELY